MQQITVGRWTSIDRKKNRFRAYHLYLAEDLWGETCLVREWGRIGKRPQQRFYWPRSDQDLARLLQGTILRRKAHGYQQN